MTRSAVDKAAKTYAGLDVSLKETAICVVDDTAKIVFERSVATDPQVIAKSSQSTLSALRVVPPRPGCGASFASSGCL